jgi:hypothetical protein
VTGKATRMAGIHPKDVKGRGSAPGLFGEAKYLKRPASRPAPTAVCSGRRTMAREGRCHDGACPVAELSVVSYLSSVISNSRRRGPVRNRSMVLPNQGASTMSGCRTSGSSWCGSARIHSPSTFARRRERSHVPATPISSRRSLARLTPSPVTSSKEPVRRLARNSRGSWTSHQVGVRGRLPSGARARQWRLVVSRLDPARTRGGRDPEDAVCPAPHASGRGCNPWVQTLMTDD